MFKHLLLRPIITSTCLIKCNIPWNDVPSSNNGASVWPKKTRGICPRMMTVWCCRVGSWTRLGDPLSHHPKVDRFDPLRFSKTLEGFGVVNFLADFLVSFILILYIDWCTCLVILDALVRVARPSDLVESIFGCYSLNCVGKLPAGGSIEIPNLFFFAEEAVFFCDIFVKFIPSKVMKKGLVVFKVYRRWNSTQGMWDYFINHDFRTPDRNNGCTRIFQWKVSGNLASTIQVYRDCKYLHHSGTLIW